jgi:hypothetical protein
MMNGQALDMKKLNRKFLLPQLNLNLGGTMRLDNQILAATSSTTATGIGIHYPGNTSINASNVIGQGTQPASRQMVSATQTSTTKSSSHNNTNRKVVASHKLIPKTNSKQRNPNNQY